MSVYRRRCVKSMKSILDRESKEIKATNWTRAIERRKVVIGSIFLSFVVWYGWPHKKAAASQA